MAAADDGEVEVAEIVPLGAHEVNTNCRYYQRKYPALDDFVVVRVKTISETAAYVHLLEYNSIEGMIPLSELSRRRIRSVNKFIRVGKTEVVQVIRVDTEKGYIDLSKKKVSPDDVRPAEVRYNRARDVHNILRHVADKCKVTLESLYQTVGWPLYKKYGHAFDAFSIAVASPEKVLTMELPEEVKNELTIAIQHRHQAQPFLVRADVEVICFEYEGIDAIKEALNEGKASNKEVPPDIKLLAAPTYVVKASSVDRDEALSAVSKCIEVVTEAIKARGGQLKVTRPPTVITGEEEIVVKEQAADDSSEGEEEEEEEEED